MIRPILAAALLHPAGAAAPADSVHQLRILVLSHEEVPSDGATTSTGNNSG